MILKSSCCHFDDFALPFWWFGWLRWICMPYEDSCWFLVIFDDGAEIHWWLGCPWVFPDYAQDPCWILVILKMMLDSSCFEDRLLTFCLIMLGFHSHWRIMLDPRWCLKRWQLVFDRFWQMMLNFHDYAEALLTWRIMLGFDDLEHDAGFRWFWRWYWIWMTMLDFDGLEDYAGFWRFWRWCWFLMILKRMLNCDYAGFCWFGGLCWIVMVLNMMLNFDD